MDGLIPNCVKGNMHLPLAIKLTSESNCFVSAWNIYFRLILITLWGLQKLDFLLLCKEKKMVSLT